MEDLLVPPKGISRVRAAWGRLLGAAAGGGGGFMKVSCVAQRLEFGWQLHGDGLIAQPWDHRINSSLVQSVVVGANSLRLQGCGGGGGGGGCQSQYH